MARKYKFALGPVLRLRQQQRELAELAVTSANGHINASKSALQETLNTEQEAVRLVHASSGGMVDVPALRRLRRHMAQVMRIRAARQQSLARASAALAQRKLELAAAARDELAIEHLRQAGFRRHAEYTNRELQAQLDEAASRIRRHTCID